MSTASSYGASVKWKNAASFLAVVPFTATPAVSSVSAGAAPIAAQWMERSAASSTADERPRVRSVGGPRRPGTRAIADLARAPPSPRAPTRTLHTLDAPAPRM